jgi:hypothetical protein
MRARTAFRACAGAAVGSAVLAAVACNVGQGPSTGIGEPIQIQGGQFVPGDLPGAPPVSDDAAAPADDAGAPALSVIITTSASSQVVPGVSSKSISGDVTEDTAAVGVRFVDEGTGYWVVPVGAPDLAVPNAFSFGMSASFDPNDAPGIHQLRFVAIGASGAAGTQHDMALCVNSRIPDNGHACSPSIAPPGAVFSLQWDTNFDLDLHVATSAGAQYSPKLPLGESLEAGVRLTPKDIPFIDRDSLRACVPDGLRQEDLVFPDGLTQGKYDIYVDPFAACGQNAVHYTLTIYVTSGTCPDCNLQPIYSRSGELLASQVTGGTAPATFVYEQVVN